MRSLTRFAAATLVSLPLLAGCAADASEDAPAGDVSEDQLRKGAAEQWVYGGSLPHLDSPSIVVSQTAHTARVTGYLPADFRGQLPYYAASVAEGGRTRIAVVYPIATGAEVNAQPASYRISNLSPWVPTNDHATWGGFPFIPYNRGIAFHGPITAQDGQWKLTRGPVSHGCNRMQGEHVVELANLIGAEMSSRVWTGASVTGLSVPVTVLRKADTWNGQSVDVDYPAAAGVKRPTQNVKMFPSWSADDLATFVCPLNKRDIPKGTTEIPAGYCAKKYSNRIDPVSGR